MLLSLSGCGQIRDYFAIKPLPPVQLKAETLKVVESLQNKPEWLFSAVSCPVDLLPKHAEKPKFLSDGCADSPNGCIKKCQTGDASACYSLALLIQEHTEIGNEVSEALFLRSCSLGIVSGCTNRAAIIFESKKDDPIAEKCAVDTFEKACSLDDAWACTMYGFALLEGISREKNLKESDLILSKACALSSSPQHPACAKANELRKLIKSNPEQ